MKNDNKSTDWSILAKLHWHGSNLLFLAGAFGSLFYIFVAPADVDRVGGGLSCVILFCLGCLGLSSRGTTFLAERVDRLEQRFIESQESAEAQSDRPQTSD